MIYLKHLFDIITIDTDGLVTKAVFSCRGDVLFLCYIYKMKINIVFFLGIGITDSRVDRENLGI